MKTVVFGACGQLGKVLQKFANSLGEVKFYTQEDCDILDYNHVKNIIKELKPSFIINAAAYTNVEKAEEEKELAKQINAEAVGNMAKIASQEGAFMFHISTDYVFDGQKNTPYAEEDKTNPLSVYGKTKAQGEDLFLQNIEKGLVIRTSWLYSEFNSNFVFSILNLAKNNKEIKVVDDKIGTPTNANDLAKFIVHIMNNKKMVKEKSLVHFSNMGVATWYDFAFYIIKSLALEVELKNTNSKTFIQKAKRPNYSVLSKDKVMNEYRYTPRHWIEGLEDCLKNLKK